MTRGGRDFCFSSSLSGSCQPPTRETNPIPVPSGDQTGFVTPFFRSQSGVGSPPSAGITYNWPFFFASRSDTKASRLPAVYSFSEFARGGGLMAYGPSVPAMFHRAAVYVDKILKGAKPADLPVERPTMFELIINMKTAKGLGLTIPPSLLLRADEVIQ